MNTYSEIAADYICQNDWVSFPELAKVLEREGIKTSGRMALQVCPNGIAWEGMSEEFFDVVCELLKSARVMIAPGGQLAYMVDGGVLEYPTAKRGPKGGLSKGYATPRWVVTYFRPKGVV